MESKKKVQGKADISLNKKGEMQALKTSKLLENKKIDLIITSPLKRARQTACGFVVEFEGMQISQFDFNKFWSYKDNIEYKKAENIRNFFKRVYDFIDDIKNKYYDKNILIVAHGGISIPFNCYFNGIPNMECLLPLCLKNCEVAIYNVRKDKIRVFTKSVYNKQKEKIYVEIYEPNEIKETIVFCHGLTGCRKGRTISDNYFQKLAIDLYFLNYKVILFDFSGHGDSEGNDLDVSLEKSTSELLIVMNNFVSTNNISFLAFSYGAAVLCNLLSKNKNIKPNKIVLFSSCLYPLKSCFLNNNSLFGKDIFKEFNNGNLKRNGYALVGSKNFKFGYKMIEECKDFVPDYYVNFNKDTLVLTGNDDVILDTSFNHAFCQKNKIKEIYLKASHSLFEEMIKAKGYTIDFLENGRLNHEK